MVEPLRYHGNEVVLFHILDPKEIDPRFRDPVVLIDLDLQRPRVARYLGLKAEQGVVSILSGRSKLRDAMVNAQIGGYVCTLLPAEIERLIRVRDGRFPGRIHGRQVVRRGRRPQDEQVRTRQYGVDPAFRGRQVDARGPAQGRRQVAALQPLQGQSNCRCFFPHQGLPLRETDPSKVA